MISRRHALGLIAAAPGALHAQARLSYDLVPVPVANGVWMIEGATEYFTARNGGAIVNCALLRGETGLIAFDTGPSRRYGEALARAARQIDLRGISAVINSHHHPDHFFGNQVFADRPIHALGQTQVLAASEGEAFADNMYRLLGDWMRGTEVVPPSRVLEGGEAVIDGRRFTAYPLAGHTGADLAVLDHQSGLLITGDLVFLDRAPTTPSADLAMWRKSLEVLSGVQAGAVLPGHGPLDTAGAAIAQTGAYLDWLGSTLRAAAAEGLDMIEIMQRPLPAEFAAMGAQPGEFRRSVAHLFLGIEREVLPRGN